MKNVMNWCGLNRRGREHDAQTKAAKAMTKARDYLDGISDELSGTSFKKGLISTTDKIKHSKELIKAINRGKTDVRRKRVQEHKWLRGRLKK